MQAPFNARRASLAWIFLLLAGTVPSAQQAQAPRPAPASRPMPSTPAARALNAGQFDEVERLLKNATDAPSIALRALSLIHI